MSDENFKRLHVVVSGHVQGVGYRYFALEEAMRLGLTGWVRNDSSGDVEVLAEGPQSELETYLDALWRGPAAARVRAVSTEWSPASREFYNFQVTF